MSRERIKGDQRMTNEEKASEKIEFCFLVILPYRDIGIFPFKNRPDIYFFSVRDVSVFRFLNFQVMSWGSHPNFKFFLISHKIPPEADL